MIAEVVRHGLDDKTALEIEAVMILDLQRSHPDLFTNLVPGHGKERGLMGLDDVRVMYEAVPAPTISDGRCCCAFPASGRL